MSDSRAVSVAPDAEGKLRRNLLTPYRHEIIVDACRKGASLTAAAAYARVSRRTVAQWRATGRQVIEFIEDGGYDEYLQRFADFEWDIQAALADFEFRHLQNVDAKSNDQWTASKWLMEQRLKDDWGSDKGGGNSGPSAPPTIEFTLNFGTPLHEITEVEAEDVTEPTPRLLGPKRESGEDDG
jgi:hypothetical protein